MGQFSSKMDGNKVIDLLITNPQGKSNTSDNDLLKKYMKYLNDGGYLLVKINITNINKMLISLWNKSKFANMSENELSKLPPHIKDFKKSIEYSSNGISPMLAASLIFIGMASLSGIFSIAVPSGAIQEKVPYDKENPYTITYNEKDPTISVVIPKIFISSNNKDFIDFLFDEFSGKKIKIPKEIDQNAVKKLQKEIDKTVSETLPKNVDKDIIKQSVSVVLEGLNRNTKNGDIRLANVINLLLNAGVLIGIGTVFEKEDPENAPDVVSELISNFFSSFPDDTCYFNNNGLISFEPNICAIKKKEANAEKQCPEPEKCPAPVKCPEPEKCPAPVKCPEPEKCPAPEKCPSNLMYIILIVILLMIALLFIILYLTTPQKIIRAPLALSETDTSSI